MWAAIFTWNATSSFWDRIPGSGTKRRRRKMSTAKNTERAANRIPLMWIVVAAFIVQIVVWTAWITFASQHRVADVPLATGR
jgi:hypothetical protein